MATVPINLCMLGKTGTGKSATGNSILGLKAFQSGSNTTSVTTEVTAETKIVGGRKVTVVDGPGIGDTRLNREADIRTSIQSFEKIMSACPRGYHAMLLFFRHGTRYTAEDRSVMAALKMLLGYDFVRKHAVLVVTCGDALKREMEEDEEDGLPLLSLDSYFSRWLDDQTDDLGSLLEELEGRVVLFDNTTKDPRVLDAQRARLFMAVDELSNRGRRYSVVDFRACEMSRLKILVGTRRERVLSDTQVKLNKISTELRTTLATPLFTIHCVQCRIICIGNFLWQVGNLRRSVEEEDKGTGVLDSVFEMIEAQRGSLHNALEGAKLLLEQLERQQREAEEMRRQHEEMRRRQEEMRRQQEEMQRQAEWRRQEEARIAQEIWRQQDAERRRREAEDEQRAIELQRQIEEEERRRRHLEEERRRMEEERRKREEEATCRIL